MKKKNDFLCDEMARVIECYHGTYYDFDYFIPLTHFGTEDTARTVLKEGKWKRDKNIDINKPKIISAHLKSGNYIEIPDLNDHYVDDWRAIVLAFLLDKTIIDDINKLQKWDNIYKKCERATRKRLSYHYDFISQSVDTDKIGQELALESLYNKNTAQYYLPTPENLFCQRMIRFFESVGINGFWYKNFTESTGKKSYIIFRQNNVIRTDKILPPMQTFVDDDKLKQIEQNFSKNYISRCLSVMEKQEWIKKMKFFYEFRVAEIQRIKINKK
ncbi:MAG: hypothetical protein MJ187_03670 [Alphaproteobacteria bacterium]|nr:hypothetical protein [Alphaproteobacteria bacterium]